MDTAETVTSVDARTNSAIAMVALATPAEQVAQRVKTAAYAAPWLKGIGRVGRAKLLRGLAAGLEVSRSEIVATADRETALGEARLNGELTRTAFQLRFMADVVEEGSYLGASVEAAGETAMGPRPALHKTAVPLGPVAVFGASNFPLAFSAPGGDTASALAAGCPVIVKAHDSHAATCAVVGKVFADCLSRFHAPAGVFDVVYGLASGMTLVQDPGICAVGFTGSLTGGRALFDLANSREKPIPFYGELGSVNPFVVTPAAARERADAIGAGFAASMTLGLGQFCTKPGLLLVPDSAAGNQLVASAVHALRDTDPGHLLNDAIRVAFRGGVRAASLFASVLVKGASTDPMVTPVLLEATIEDLCRREAAVLLEERFGPFGVVARYRSMADVYDVLQHLPPALTGTVHTADEDLHALAVIEELAKRSGRVVNNGYPTGVAVAWGMNHGGPYPASTVPSATSVGAAAVTRWVRPVTYQDVPEAYLPDELRTVPRHNIVRRIDGRLQTSGPQRPHTFDSKEAS